MDDARNQILQKYGISPEVWLNRGMEAEVYAYGSDAVLKLYDRTATLADLLRLQTFYASLERQSVPFTLPQVHSVEENGRFLITTEQRLAGKPLYDVLPTLTNKQLDEMMAQYVTAVLAISRIKVSPEPERYKLFDPDGISNRKDGDWHQFLSRYLTHKLVQLAPYLNRDVVQFEMKMQRMEEVLKRPFQGNLQLIHGDFCPGNLQVSDDDQIIAVLDFGLLTMFGDYLFDVATSWVFFDMYARLKDRLRDRYLALLIETLGEGVCGKLYRYVLIYSILSANTYSATCSDGHYQWCVANLNHQPYWDAIE